MDGCRSIDRHDRVICRIIGWASSYLQDIIVRHISNSVVSIVSFRCVPPFIDVVGAYERYLEFCWNIFNLDALFGNQKKLRGLRQIRVESLMTEMDIEGCRGWGVFLVEFFKFGGKRNMTSSRNADGVAWLKLVAEEVNLKDM
jgi:hypothetical protein